MLSSASDVGTRKSPMAADIIAVYDVAPYVAMSVTNLQSFAHNALTVGRLRTRQATLHTSRHDHPLLHITLHTAMATTVDL